VDSSIIIKRSRIQGKGVFARRDIKKGELIIDHPKCSKQISLKEFEKISNFQKKFVSILKGKYILFYSPARYVNHSCAANTKVSRKGDVALRNIKKGEEITANYSFELPNIGFKCKCGKCKGRILF